MNSSPDRTRSLPVELWTEVFEFAAYVPGLMDVDIADPFDLPTCLTPFSPWSDIELQDALHCKSSMSLVCKHWRSMVLPIIYRCLVVRDEQDALVLTETLRTSKVRADDCQGAATGTWVRHLVVRAPSRRYDLAPLAHYLPNLDILTAPNLGLVTPSAREASIMPPSLQKSFLRTLVEVCGPALLRLSIGGFPSARDDPNLILSSAPRLRTLLCVDASLCPIVFYRPPHLQFLSIHAWSPDRRATDERFPSVRHAVINNPGFFRGKNGWTHFLKIQGHHLTTLHLDFTATPFTRSIGSWSHIVSQACPNLLRLVVYIARLPVSFSLGGVPPTPYLGIHFEERLDELRGSSQILVQALLEIDCSSPKVVRFLNANVSAVLRAHFKEEGMATQLREAVATGRLCLQDHMGNSLGPPS